MLPKRNRQPLHTPRKWQTVAAQKTWRVYDNGGGTILRLRSETFHIAG
jgi:hypothetical protein